TAEGAPSVQVKDIGRCGREGLTQGSRTRKGARRSGALVRQCGRLSVRSPASAADGQSTTVRTLGPSSVMAIVFSECAPFEPSARRSVHPSLSTVSFFEVNDHHGSIARVRPGL